MRRFKFSLQTLHELREHERDQAERALARATAALAEALALVEAALTEIDKAIARYSAVVRKGNIAAHEADTYSRYIASLDQKLESARTCRAEREHERELRIQDLIKATSAVEATAKLREQHYQRYVAELAREEQNVIDELATISSSRRLKGTS